MREKWFTLQSVHLPHRNLATIKMCKEYKQSYCLFLILSPMEIIDTLPLLERDTTRYKSIVHARDARRARYG